MPDVCTTSAPATTVQPIPPRPKLLLRRDVPAPGKCHRAIRVAAAAAGPNVSFDMRLSRPRGVAPDGRPCCFFCPYYLGVTHVVMSAWTTSAPRRSKMRTGTTTSVPAVIAPKSGNSVSSATARSGPFALAR